MRVPELLSPAGDMEKLRAALDFGADAVYLAGLRFGMRQNAGNFDGEGLREAVALAHARGVRVYVAVNALPRSDEADELPAWLSLLEDAGADAVIVSDLGVLRMAQAFAPDLAIHLSTQVSVTNYAAACAWYDLGVKRIVLARELTLEEIRAIRGRTPAELELEAFVHGAMCVSYSGRCLLSAALAGRSADRGACAQPCRWSYALCEEKRPGEYLPVEEQGGETFILNAKDLRMIDHLPELAAAGVCALKIEGRGKTALYAAAITNAYRLALDGFAAEGAGWKCPPELLEETEKVSHRPYDTGFYFGPHDLQHRADTDYVRPWELAALQLSVDGCEAVLQEKSRFSPADTLEWLVPRAWPQPAELLSLAEEDGTPLAAANRPHMTVRARFARPVPKGAILRKRLSDENA